jgi:phage terminase large subunit-like protein
MSLQQAIESLNLKTLKSGIPEGYTDYQRASLEKRLKELVGSPKMNSKQLSNFELQTLIALVDEADKRENTSGFHKWFQPGTPYGIDKLLKHKELFKATKLYREVLMLGGNRCGKTRAGATFISILATGQYPDWWEGVRFVGPVSLWAAGKTGQTTRDTVQEALMGPVGAWGTGALPLESIGRTTARQGIPNALDTVEVKCVGGGTSTIGFKSYDQKAHSFYGTAKHAVWLDEPCPDLVYNECLIRTMTTGGRVMHTITPKEGLTRLIAEFLSSCDLLAGAERIKGLEAMLKLQDMEEAMND